jgi:hypothetical protein
MAEVTLTCVSAEDARIVAAENTLPGDESNTIRQDGDRVIIAYFDKRYPLDVSDYAFQTGHASDTDAANTIARL